MWLDFSFALKQWLYYAEPGYEVDLTHIEEHLNSPIVYNQSPEGEKSKERSKRLYVILSGLLVHRPLKVLKQVVDSNGFEVWRQLSSLYSPRTKTRSLGILNALMAHPSFVRERTILEHIQGLERLADEYRRASGSDVNDDILLTTLVKCLPAQLRQHVQLTMDEASTFQLVKDKCIAYERLSMTWSKDKVYAELGAVTSYTSDSGGPSAMEVNQISKGKSKGKGAKGKSGSKGKGKDKGKSNSSNYKGKGKSQQSGKGYATSTAKGGGKNQSKNADANRCNYCGGNGHWKRDCRKFQADKASGQVRQVENEDSTQRATSSPSNHSTAQHSTSATSYRSGGNVNRVAFNESSVVIEDLTEFSQPASHSSIRVVQLACSQQFDMSCTDQDDSWTCAPGCNIGLPVRNHVRMMSAAGELSSEIILDSGADTSALPLSYGSVGESCNDVGLQDYIDAQGGKLDIRDTRLATVDLGNGVILRERFIIANISSPLLAMGHIVRAGWELHHLSDGIYLVKNDKSISVNFRRNSLCVQGCIRMVSQDDCFSPKASDTSPGEIRAIHLEPVLRRLLPGWNRINPQLFVLRTRRPNFIDTTVCPSTEMMWLRTTLVFRDGRGWELLEFSEPVSEMEELEGAIYDPESVLEVLTLAHAHCVPSEDLGFRLIEGDQRPIFDDDIPPDEMQEGDDQPQPVHEAPADTEEAEPLDDEDRVIPFEEDSSVAVEGVVYTPDSSLRGLRAGCTALGLSKRGSKKECFKRMVEYMRTQSLITSQSVEAKLKQGSERHAVPQRKPKEPSEQVRDVHALTHEPYEEWCSLCVSNRARQDPHRRQTHESVGHSVVSFDFGYCSRMRDETDKLTVLVIHDRDTNMCAALPTQQKGGRSFQYLVTEMSRFIVQTGHTELSLKCDCEPSTTSLAEAVRKACAGLRIVVHLEPTPTGDHQANGAAEAMVHVLRTKANLLVQQIEEATGCTKPVFGCLHPVYAWAVVHSSWLHNHFVVNKETTGYERSTGRLYSGKLALFGETVLGYLKTDLKGLPKWSKGVWLTKTMMNDCHVIGTATGIFVTRSIRRLPCSFQLEQLGDLTACPWEYGYANLGHRLVYSKRVSQPFGVAVGANLQLGDKEALAVRDYARAHPFEDADPSAISAEAGIQPSEVTGNAEVPAATVASEGTGNGGPSSSARPDSGMQQAGDSLSGSSKHAIEHDDVGAEAKRLHFSGYDDNLPHGDVVPQTPVSVAGDLLDDTPIESMMSPAKASKHDTTGEISLLGVIRNIEHLDIEPDVPFSSDNVDALIQHELNLDEDPYEVEIDVGACLKELSYPYTPQEPDLPQEELQKLDALADQVEIQRLVGLEVLKHDGLPLDCKTLSTRFVRTWREKKNDKGEAIWLRRSRLVAREYTWLQPDRESLFSPATSSLASRILPICFLAMREHQDCIMASIDVKDAFLTVKQEVDTRVTCTDASGNSVQYSLGRVLPGQRDGSLLWYKDLAKFVKECPLEMAELDAYPSILRSKNGDCFLMVHVDDLLIVGSRDAVMKQLVPSLQSKYAISIELMAKPGDEVTFLKRTHELLEDGRMVIRVHHKHLDQLCKLLCLSKKLQCKKTPGHSEMETPDKSPELNGQDASTYRTCVGILLYLSADLPQCQYVTRYLSTFSSKPTAKSMMVLKHLVGYMAAHADQCMSLKWKGLHAGVFKQYENEEPMVEIFSDADWAADRETRRSVSGAAIYVGGCLAYSSSRTQKIVSLSSAESETYAAASATMDAILITTIFSWLLRCHFMMCLYLDSSAARGVLSRKGVGRLRHLSCRILWMQDLVMEKRLLVRSVMGALNPADIATKRLSAARLESLCYFLGIWRGNNLEGAHDPGNLFRHVTSQRQQGHSQAQINLLISALSVLTQLQGCDAMDSLASFNAIFLFTWLLGLLGYLYLAIRPGQSMKSFDFVADAETSDDGTEDPIDNSDEISTASEYPPWSEEGMIHWMYDRCERRLHKAAHRQDPQKTGQYQARQGILSDMLAMLETATNDTRHQIRMVLEDITDLSSDEDSPTMNTGGHAAAMDVGLTTGIGTAFIHGIAGMTLSGCDGVYMESSNDPMISFTTLVLTLWTMLLGGYTWYWLRRPMTEVTFPPTDLMRATAAPEPEVTEDLQLEGKLLVALRRINGRLRRAEKRGNRGQCLKHMQSRTWLLSCVSHYTSCSPAERLRMAEVVSDTCSLSEDDESPQHNLGEVEKNFLISEGDKAFRAMMALLEYDTAEEVCKLIEQLGSALRETIPESPKSDEPMEETLEAKARRYQNCEQCEASDPEFWADVHYGPRAEEENMEEDDTGLQEF